MLTNLIKAFGILVLCGLAVTVASGQFTITIPKIPKIPKITKQEPKSTPQPTVSGESSETTSVSENSGSAPKKTGSNCSDDWWVKAMSEDIAKTRKEAEEFRPGLRGYYVSELNDRKNIHLESALSPSKREEWFTDAKLDAAKIGCMNTMLDDLASVARKTLPTYTGPSGYTFGTPAEKKVLLSAIGDIVGVTILKVGLNEANWLIAKDDYNFPTARYKHGVIWTKYAKADDGFCRILLVNLKQDYAGGGTYGASYGYYISRSFAGCPAGK